MKATITKNPTDCALGGSSSPAMPVYKYVAFTSNCYSDSKATLEYFQDGKPEEHHYNCIPETAAHDLIRKGMSASFLKAEPVLVDKPKYNEQALAFYNAVREAILTVGFYKVVVGVNIKPDHMDDAFTQWFYTPFFLRSFSSQEHLVVEVPVAIDYNTILESPEVLAYVAQHRTEHEAYLAERALKKVERELEQQRKLSAVTALMTDAKFVELNGNVLHFMSVDSQAFSVYATMIDYEECALSVGGIDI